MTTLAMTTKEAFEIYMNTPALVEKSGIKPGHLRVLRKKLRENRLAEKAMTKWLTAAGFWVEISWSLPI